MPATATATHATDSSANLPPMLDGGVPLLGHALEMRKNPVELFQRGYDRHGSVYQLKLPRSPRTVAMIGPKAHEKFFRRRDDEVSMREVYALMTPIFGKGIAYDAPPEVMREQLGFFHEALRERRMRTYAQGFVEEAERYFDAIGDEAVVDLYEVGNELTIYTSSRSLLGKDFRDRLSGEFARVYYEMEAGLNVIAFIAPHLPLPSFRRRDRARERLYAMIKQITDQRRRENTTGEDFLQTLMDAKYKDGRPLSDDEITGLLLAIMFAGHHTSGVTFAWTGILLHQNPQYIEPLLDEQRAILGGRNEITLEDLHAMHKLECCVKETLRLYPPIIMLARKLLVDIECEGYRIPADTTIMASPAVAHRIPEVFPNPNRFEPERFGPERAEDKKHPMAWIAFGAGRHRCMGIVFAQLQLRAIWSHILRNFEVELLEPTYEPDYTRLLVGPRKPCRARLVRKKTKTTVAVG